MRLPRHDSTFPLEQAMKRLMLSDAERRTLRVEQGKGIQQDGMVDFIRAGDQAAYTFFPFGKNFIADGQDFPGLFG